jgi:formamidopyrimidine-DNA glycosylase
MPEYPDITVYIECLTRLLAGQQLEAVRVNSPFVLRTATPPLTMAHGATVQGFARLGKRIVFELRRPDGEALFLVLHLMIAGRLHWRKPGVKLGGKQNLAAFDFAHGTLLLTEASTKKRAALHVIAESAGLQELDRGGLDFMQATPEAFAQALRRENHTLKRALTDPRLFSGIGNAYSDEILHAARLSPLRLSQQLDDAEVMRLHAATVATMQAWTERLRAEAGLFPQKVTAFRPEMSVHGRYGQPCPVCQAPVQRIRYAENETNYCAVCQNQGKLLADRALSRLLKQDWPKTLEELEEQKQLRRIER